MQKYRDWWKDNYGTVVNNQAAIVAASFTAHVLKEHDDARVAELLDEVGKKNG